MARKSPQSPRFDELGFEILRALFMAGEPLGARELRRRLAVKATAARMRTKIEGLMAGGHVAQSGAGSKCVWSITKEGRNRYVTIMADQESVRRVILGEWRPSLGEPGIAAAIDSAGRVIDEPPLGILIVREDAAGTGAPSAREPGKPATRETIAQMGRQPRGSNLGFFVGADGERYRMQLVRVDDPELATERMWVKLVELTRSHGR